MYPRNALAIATSVFSALVSSSFCSAVRWCEIFSRGMGRLFPVLVFFLGPRPPFWSRKTGQQPHSYCAEEVEVIYYYCKIMLWFLSPYTREGKLAVDAVLIGCDVQLLPVLFSSCVTVLKYCLFLFLENCIQTRQTYFCGISSVTSL